MKVKLTSALVGNDQTLKAGTVIETDEAVRLINAGVAVPHIEAATIETASAKPAVERAIKARTKKSSA